MKKLCLVFAALLSIHSCVAHAGRIGRGTGELPIYPTTDFTLSDWYSSSSNNGPYTYILANTHISGSCAGTLGATCAVDKSQLLSNGVWPGVNGLDRVIQTAEGGWFQGHIDNGPTVQAPGTILKLTTAVTGTALADGQLLYTGPLPNTTIVSGSGTTWTITPSQKAGVSAGNPVSMTNNKGQCFNGYIDDGAGNAGTTLKITNQGPCINAATATAIAVGQTINGGDNSATWSASLENQGAFRFICVSSHINYDDPVLFPGIQGGSPHLHNFFGNTLTDYTSTYQSLRTTGGGSCAGGPANRTGYWFPALIDPLGMSGAGAVVQPDYIEIYYKGDRAQMVDQFQTGAFREVKPIFQLARGLRYITGFNPKTGIQYQSFFWTCPEGAGAAVGSQPNLPSLWSAMVAGGWTSHASCPRIEVRMDASHCWGGQINTSNPFTTIVAATDPGNWGTKNCLTPTPFTIPFVTFIVVFNRGSEDVSKWFLASDCIPGASLANCAADGNLLYTAGTSFHSDWFGAWDVTIMDTWMTNCLQIGSRYNDPTYLAGPNDTQNSSAGNMCNGTALKTSGGTTPSGYVSPPITTAESVWPAKYLPIPARP